MAEPMYHFDMTQQARQRPQNFITRFEAAYEQTCKKYLPDWLYKIAIMHPDRLLGPKGRSLSFGRNVPVYLGVIFAVIILCFVVF